MTGIYVYTMYNKMKRSKPDSEVETLVITETKKTHEKEEVLKVSSDDEVDEEDEAADEAEYKPKNKKAKTSDEVKIKGVKKYKWTPVGDMQVQDVSGDGKCLFHALFVAFWNSQSPTTTLTKSQVEKGGERMCSDVIKYIQDNVQYHDILEDRDGKKITIEEYVKSMEENGWGGDTEITAFCNMKNMKVNYFMMKDDVFQCVRTEGVGDVDTISLYHHNKNHWMAVRENK